MRGCGVCGKKQLRLVEDYSWETENESGGMFSKKMKITKHRRLTFVCDNCYHNVDIPMFEIDGVMEESFGSRTPEQLLKNTLPMRKPN